MIDWAQKRMEALGIQCTQHDIGNQTLPDGTVLKLPNVVFGVLGNVSHFIMHIMFSLSRYFYFC
jgi:hypothetical protein